MRRLKGLESLIDVSVTHWLMLDDGWTFAPGAGVIADTVNGVKALHGLYRQADPRYTGRATVPVLWDKKTGTMVNNESSEIIRMMNAAFDAQGAAPGDYYPAALRDEIDTVNKRVYDTVNNGVYRCGFATTQEAYESAAHALFDSLDWLEARLAEYRYLIGARITEADVRLFTTLVRFDPVYHSHFKCSKRRLVDYPNLWAYTRELYQLPAFGPTVDFTHIRGHYFASMRRINPTGIVPLAYELDFAQPHGRE
jgi:glutathionyl-hydroquinone reductase